MTCNLCGVNEASIHLTEIVNNQMVEVHLCEQCAQEKGTDFKTHFSLDELLAGLTDTSKSSKAVEKKASVCCPQCAMTYEEFGKIGRLGCANCYGAFEKLLLPLIKRVQRATHHIGKKPSKLPKQARSVHDLRILQERLRKSVQSEAFEDAAKIRDEIKQIEDKNKKGKKKS